MIYLQLHSAIPDMQKKIIFGEKHNKFAFSQSRLYIMDTNFS